MSNPNHFTKGNREVKIKRDSVWQEYYADLYVDGILQRKARYHTDDLKDARDTAKEMIK